jgi:vanillin dehydrogenase
VADPFADKLAEKASALNVGDPRDPETQIGPLINDSAMARVKGLVDDAVEHGPEVLSGGEPDGPLFPPTVLEGVTPAMRVYYEESFAPVVGIVPVDGRSAWPTTPSTGSQRRSSASTCPPRSSSPSGSRAASAT